MIYAVVGSAAVVLLGAGRTEVPLGQLVETRFLEVEWMAVGMATDHFVVAVLPVAAGVLPHVVTLG